MYGIHFSHSFPFVTFAHRKKKYLIFHFQFFFPLDFWALLYASAMSSYHRCLKWSIKSKAFWFDFCEIYSFLRFEYRYDSKQKHKKPLPEVTYNKWAWLARFIRAKKKKKIFQHLIKRWRWCDVDILQYKNIWIFARNISMSIFYHLSFRFCCCLWYGWVMKKLTVISVETKISHLDGLKNKRLAVRESNALNIYQEVKWREMSHEIIIWKFRKWKTFFVLESFIKFRMMLIFGIIRICKSLKKEKNCAVYWVLYR